MTCEMLKHMETLFGWICRQPDEQRAIVALEDSALRELLGYLASQNILSGIPGIIYGHALVEAAKRFTKQTNA